MISQHSSLQTIKRERDSRQNVLQKYLLVKNTANQINIKLAKEKYSPSPSQQKRKSSLSQKPQLNRQSLTHNILNYHTLQGFKQSQEKWMKPSSYLKNTLQNTQTGSQKKISRALIKVLLRSVLVKNSNDSQTKQKEKNFKNVQKQNIEKQNKQIKINNFSFLKKGIIHSQPKNGLQFLQKIINKHPQKTNIISHRQTLKSKRNQLFSPIIKIRSKNFTERRSLRFEMNKNVKTQWGICCAQQSISKIKLSHPKLKQISTKFAIRKPTSQTMKFERGDQFSMSYLCNLTEISQATANKNKSVNEDKTLDPWSTQQIHIDEQKFYEHKE